LNGYLANYCTVRVCKSVSFHAVHAHIVFVLIAYILKDELTEKQKTIQNYQTTKTLKVVRKKMTQIGQVSAARTIINEALERMAS
jgi:hypothetical protein